MAREPAFACVDEPRALGDMPMPLDSLLEQARGLGVGICVAPQSDLRSGAKDPELFELLVPAREPGQPRTSVGRVGGS